MFEFTNKALKYLYYNHIKYETQKHNNLTIPSDLVKYQLINNKHTGRNRNKFPTIYRGVILSGEWDKHNELYEKSYYYRGLYKHFVKDMPWKETEYGKKIIGIYEKEDATIHGYKTVDDFFKSREKLYDSLSKDGYQIERSGRIPVSITRNGAFIYNRNTQHRMAMSKILSLDIPIRVLARHKRWASIRNEIKSTNDYKSLSSTAKKYINHPDIQNQVPDDWTK